MSLDLGTITTNTKRLDYDEAFCKLINIRKEISDSNDPSTLIAYYKQDKTFNELFCYDEHVLDNINDFIDNSNETLLQDWLVYGIVGLIGRAMYSNLKRIRTICSKHSGKAGGMVKRYISQYLPDYPAYEVIIKKMDVMNDAFMSLAKDPSMDFTKIIDALHKVGVKTKDGYVKSQTSIDWSAVAGAIAFRYIFAAITGGVGIFVGAALGHMAVRIASKNGRPIGKRGWDSDKVGKAATKIVQLCDNLEKMKIKPNFDKNDPDFKYKVRFYKQVVKAYTQVLYDLGRGVAGACEPNGWNIQQ